MGTVRIRADYYQQFDADYSRDVPAEGYGGWKQAALEIDPERTALVVMHAWDFATYEEYPGWYRAIEYIPRAREILQTVLPGLLSCVRRSGMQLFHVVSEGSYYKEYPGYRRACELAGPGPAPPEQVELDPTRVELDRFKAGNSSIGPHNRGDVERAFKRTRFPAEAEPQGEEGIAENSQQLFALCKEARVNHLIYAGFAINWCILLSAGGMVDMRKRGLMCSAVRQAVTAVENRETARSELCKETALWRVALAFGFVFDANVLVSALEDRYTDSGKESAAQPRKELATTPWTRRRKPRLEQAAGRQPRRKASPSGPSTRDSCPA